MSRERKNKIHFLKNLRTLYCSIAKPCLTLFHLMDCSKPGSPVLHYLPEFAQTYVHWIRDAIIYFIAKFYFIIWVDNLTLQIIEKEYILESMKCLIFRIMWQRLPAVLQCVLLFLNSNKNLNWVNDCPVKTIFQVFLIANCGHMPKFWLIVCMQK